MRVLFVDDDPHATAPHQFALSRRGHEVRVIEDPVDAWDAYREFDPDILFLDLVFLSSTCRYGLMLFHDLRSALWRQDRLICPVCVFTALDEPAELAAAERAGVDAILVKPVTVAVFLAEFERLTRKERKSFRLIDGGRA